jgi:hypothetical protein
MIIDDRRSHRMVDLAATSKYRSLRSIYAPMTTPFPHLFLVAKQSQTKLTIAIQPSGQLLILNDLASV